MINLMKEEHYRLYDEKEGLLLKHWVNYKGDRYLFKANYRYPMMNTYTNYGEVFYSRVLRKLGVNCVEAEFAIDTIQGSPTKGVLIKNYVTDEYMDSMSYKKIFDFYLNSKNNLKHLSKFSSVEACLLAVKDFADRFDFTVDYKQLEKDLVKMTICDFFFSQSDRHDNNIEFLFTHDREMKLAPIFDNGFNLGFPYFEELSQHYADEKCKKEGSFNGAYTIFTLRDGESMNEKERELEQLDDISLYLKMHPKFITLVRDIANINVAKEIDEMESDCHFEIPPSYKTVGQTILDTRLKIFEEYLVKNGETELSRDIFGDRYEIAERQL